MDEKRTGTTLHLPIEVGALIAGLLGIRDLRALIRCKGWLSEGASAGHRTAAARVVQRAWRSRTFHYREACYADMSGSPSEIQNRRSRRRRDHEALHRALHDGGKLRVIHLSGFHAAALSAIRLACPPPLRWVTSSPSAGALWWVHLPMRFHDAVANVRLVTTPDATIEAATLSVQIGGSERTISVTDANFSGAFKDHLFFANRGMPRNWYNGSQFAITVRSRGKIFIVGDCYTFDQGAETLQHVFSGRCLTPDATYRPV